MSDKKEPEEEQEEEQEERPDTRDREVKKSKDPELKE